MEYINIVDYSEYLKNNAIGRYCFKGISWWLDSINYKINTSDYTIEIKSHDYLMFFTISFYDNFPSFIIMFSPKDCSISIRLLKEHISIRYDYDTIVNEKTLQLPEFAEIVYNTESDISSYEEEFMKRLLNEDRMNIEFPNIEDIINFIEEPKELLGVNYTDKILEILNETDALNWHVILNQFITRPLELYLPPIIV